MTFDQVAKAAEGRLLAARQQGHAMDREAARGADGDLRVTWKCAACGERIIAIAQRGTRFGAPWEVSYGGHAVERRCTAG